jgi:hypothetical protein
MCFIAIGRFPTYMDRRVVAGCGWGSVLEPMHRLGLADHSFNYRQQFLAMPCHPSLSQSSPNPEHFFCSRFPALSASSHICDYKRVARGVGYV